MAIKGNARREPVSVTKHKFDRFHLRRVSPFCRLIADSRSLAVAFSQFAVLWATHFAPANTSRRCLMNDAACCGNGSRVLGRHVANPRSAFPTLFAYLIGAPHLTVHSVIERTSRPTLTGTHVLHGFPSPQRMPPHEGDPLLGS